MEIEPDDLDDSDELPDFQDTDIPPPETVVAQYNYLAQKHGLIEEGGTITKELHAFVTDVVAACIGWASKPGQAFSAAYLIREQMMPEPLEEYERKRPERERADAERSAQLRKQFPRASLRHPDDSGNLVVDELLEEASAYGVFREGEAWVVRGLRTGKERYRGPGPVEILPPDVPV